LHIGKSAAALIGDVAILADHVDLAPAAEALAKRAWQAMLDGAPEDELRRMIRPLALRLWGARAPVAGRYAAEAYNRERFIDGFVRLTATCDTAAELDIPHLPPPQARAIIAELVLAVGNLRRLLRRIEESNQ
jgi:hypothetical protein